MKRGQSPKQQQQPSPSSGGNAIVNLNVGGTRFTTTLATLRSHPGSTLSSMFDPQDGPQLQLDSAGNYFIDRDGSHFRHILNFLRDGTLPPNTEAGIRKEMKMEAAYYNLTQLLAWAQAYDYDEVNSVSSAAASVLDVYTSVAKSMLAKVYGRGYDELVGEAVAHLTAAASQGSPVARLTLYGKVDGSRDFLIPTTLGSSVLLGSEGGCRRVRPEEVGAPGLEAGAETFVQGLEEMGFPCSAADGKVLVDIQHIRPTARETPLASLAADGALMLRDLRSTADSMLDLMRDFKRRQAHAGGAGASD